MYCAWLLYTYSAMRSFQTSVLSLDLVLQGSMGVSLGAGGVLLLGMYRLEPNCWVQSGAEECKGLRPALPLHHTTMVLHHSYPDAVHMPSIGVYTGCFESYCAVRLQQNSQHLHAITGTMLPETSNTNKYSCVKLSQILPLALESSAYLCMFVAGVFGPSLPVCRPPAPPQARGWRPASSATS